MSNDIKKNKNFLCLDDLVNELDVNNSEYLAIYSSKKNHYSAYLMNDVEEVHHYTKLFHVLENMETNEVIDLHLCSYGGYADTAMCFRNFLLSCQGTINCYLECNCMSAMTMIALACDNFYVSESSCNFMIHAPSWGISGKLNEVKDASEFEISQNEQLVKDIYKNFLTAQEIKKVIEGKDIYLNGKQVLVRLEKYYNKRQGVTEEVYGYVGMAD